jgi:hypothetical protein
LVIWHRRLSSASGEDSRRTHQDHSSHPGKLRLAVEHFKRRADHAERRTSKSNGSPLRTTFAAAEFHRINNIGIEVRMTVSSVL